LRWLTAASVFVTGYCLARKAENARLMLRVFLILAACVAFYGLVRLSLKLDTILWFEQAHSSSLTSGFINRNHAATFFGMCALAALGLVIEHIGKIVRSSAELSGFAKLQMSVDKLAGGLGLDMLLFVVFLAVLLLSGSRGGLVFTMLAMLVMVLLQSVRGWSRRSGGLSGAVWVLIALMIGLLVLGVFEMSGARVMGRMLSEGLESDLRLDTYARSMAAIKDYLWIGSGLGTFQDVFPAYRLDIAADQVIWDKAHNDYIELVLGLGLPAALLVLVAILALVIKALEGFFSRRRDAHYCAIAVCVSVLVALHSLVDFSLQIQANALSFALLLGLGLGQSVSSRI
jgi:O-antigen ligase